ncbi:MAG TPA: hypothetical protein VHB74_06810 [Devosia sp.]|nr:hypothetical protein [Devosia sp.]
MRLAFVAVLAVAAGVSPALADTASDFAAAKANIAAAKLSHDSDLDMWCGAAVTLMSATTQADPASAQAMKDAATLLLQRGTAALAAAGLARDKVDALTNDYMTVAAAELLSRLDTPAYGQQACEDAASK